MYKYAKMQDFCVFIYKILHIWLPLSGAKGAACQRRNSEHIDVRNKTPCISASVTTTHVLITKRSSVDG